MALSMEEQRILVEIESRLKADDPGFARRLSSHGRTRQRHSRRTRLIATFLLIMMGTSIVMGSAIAYVFA